MLDSQPITIHCLRLIWHISKWIFFLLILIFNQITFYLTKHLLFSFPITYTCVSLPTIQFPIPSVLFAFLIHKTIKYLPASSDFPVIYTYISIQSIPAEDSSISPTRNFPIAARIGFHVVWKNENGHVGLGVGLSHVFLQPRKPPRFL